MATVARLLPRFWDGRRLLQFLTGLALIALAFTIPALPDPADQPAESPVTIITTVDTPGLPVTDVPAAPRLSTDHTSLALGPQTPTPTKPPTPATGTGVATGTGAGPATQAAHVATRGAHTAAQGAQAGSHGPGSADLGVAHGATGLPPQAWHGRRLCFENRATTGSAAHGAHGERAPPRA